MARGIAFSVDAIIAFTVILALVPAITLMTSLPHSTTQIEEAMHEKAASAAGILDSLTVADLQRDPYVIGLFREGLLADSDYNNTILETVGLLWSLGNLTAAGRLASIALDGAIPDGTNWALYVEGDEVFNTSESEPIVAVASSSRLVSGIAKFQPGIGCVARSFLQKIRGKREEADYFFGGFVGEGNVTAVVQGVPSDAVVSGVYVEASLVDNFTLLVNGFNCGILNSSSDGSVYNWTVNSSACLAKVVPGSPNNVTLVFNSSDLKKNFIGGGLGRIIYSTATFSSEEPNVTREYLPGISGLFNYYSSFYVPGNVTNVSARLRFFNNFTTFLVVGNKTLYDRTGTGDIQVVTLGDSNFTTAFGSYSAISGKTIPVRLGVEANVTGGTGNADVVLITDISGSMGDRMDSNSGGFSITNCSSPALWFANTSRISVAKCIDKEFVDAVLGGVGNRVGLVAFSTSTYRTNYLSTNATDLKAEIDNYADTDNTCLACGINSAYEILKANGTQNRSKYVVVMTDGAANQRATPACGVDYYGLDGNASNAQLVGSNGAVANYSAGSWPVNLTGNGTFNDVSVLNSTFAMAADDAGQVWTWNGTLWRITARPTTSSMTGIAVFNATQALAVSSDKNVYGWNGVVWASQKTTASALRDVMYLNSTRAYAVGDSGKVNRGDKGTWVEEKDTGSNNLYGIDFANASWIFAVGSAGEIHLKSPSSDWATYYDSGSNTYRSIDVVNGSYALAVTTAGQVYRWNGIAWSQVVDTTATFQSVRQFNSTLAYAVGLSNAIYVWTGSSWGFIGLLPITYAGNLTVSPGDCGDDESCTNSVDIVPPALNANYSSCRANVDLNATVHSVGFGPVASCTLIGNTLQRIAACGNGTFFQSDNSTQLADFYRAIAKTIVTQTNGSQTVSVAGDINTTLYGDSYLEFRYSPYSPPPDYQEISVTLETSPFPSCEGSFFIPSQFSVQRAKVTSYSSDRWTSNVSVTNTWTGGHALTVFNLSAFNQTSYLRLGDPFMVEFPASLLRSNEWNNVSVRTASAPGNQSSTCSGNNKAIYSARFTAAVNYSSVLSECRARNVTVYYDSNFDGVADGSVNVSIGSGLPLSSAGPVPVTPDRLNTTSNAVEESFRRLLGVLNFVNPTGSTAAAGTEANPIDIVLDKDVGSNSLFSSEVPYAWGPAEVRLVVWK